MSLGAIKRVCLKYGLRFLPTRFYKGELDSGIGPKVEEFKALLGELPIIFEEEVLAEGPPANIGKSQFYIAAPSESFALTLAPKDPLLFCRLSLDKFFLVHKWGKDLVQKDVKAEIDESNWNSAIKKIDDRDYYLIKQNSIAQPLYRAGMNMLGSTATGMSIAQYSSILGLQNNVPMVQVQIGSPP
jgi:hypothetical protein